MKKNLLILALAAISCQTFANQQVTSYIWRSDDGDLISASPLAEVGTPITVNDPNAVIRLRVRVDNMQDAAKNITGLKYLTTPSAVKISADNTSLIEVLDGTNGAAFEFTSSAYVSDGTATESMGLTATTVQSGNIQSTFTPGLFQTQSLAFAVPTLTFSEVEYCIKPTTDIVDGTTYYFIPGGDIDIYPENGEKFPELTYTFTSSIKSATKLTDVTVSYPSSDLVQFSSLPKGAATVSIINTVGKVVKTFNASATDGSLSFSTSDLAQGMYIAQIKSGNVTVNQKIRKI